MDSVFRETLRSELDFQDIKVKELAVKTGISQRTLEGYLGARGSIPPADVAVRIAQVLNVSVEYLVTGDSEQNVKSKEAAGGCLADVISGLPMGKRQLLKEMLAVLQNFDVARKPQAE
ncbi:MAG: helix-turn-helix domain-containing protein [Treponemataceae bacterium]|nr:helix-turn-helix domain-containing protein [Treponemataceae bacterium]